jgi:methylglutaconyl-CoA hydratase
MISQIKEGYVRTEEHGRILTIEFFHPQSNSLPASLIEELTKEIHSAGHNEDIRVIILSSGGDRVFCAGASFDELAAIQTKDQGTSFFSGFAHVINAMRKCPQFIIARIQGKCVGGGVGIAAAADYAIAMESAEIKLTELALGFGPFVVGPAIERKIGISAFSQLMIDAGLWRSADWARKKGLFAELHSSVEAMDESIRRLAQTLANGNPEAMRELKRINWHGTENWDHLLLERAALSGKFVISPVARQAIQKMRAKRKES